MSEKETIFIHKKVIKSNFYENKKLTDLDNLAVSKIIVKKKKINGKKRSFKHFNGYDDNDHIMSLCIKCAKYFDNNKAMSVKVSDKELLKKYIKIWKKKLAVK